MQSTFTPPRWTHVLLANVLSTAALVGLLCLSGELYFRFIYDTPDGLAYSKVTVRWFERYWLKNQNGMRDNVNYPLEVPAEKRRVTFIGDSFAAGQGVKSVEERFANLIRQNHPEWDVQILAVPGYDTGGELRMLQDLLQHDYELDEVVLVYCLNDISDIVPGLQDLLRRIAAESRSRPWLLRNSYLFDILSYRASLWRNPYIRNYYNLVEEAYGGPLWDTQQRRLLALRAMVESKGGHLSVVTFPFFVALDNSYPFAGVHRQLQSFWSDSGTPNLDLLALYSGHDIKSLVVGPLDQHPNEKAHAMAALAIGDFVARQIDSASRPASLQRAASP